MGIGQICPMGIGQICPVKQNGMKAKMPLNSLFMLNVYLWGGGRRVCGIG